MMVFVVDTNVAIVANGRETHADGPCQFACIVKLERVVEQEIVAIDCTNFILDEYRNYLCHSGQPGVGDAFLNTYSTTNTTATKCK